MATILNVTFDKSKKAYVKIDGMGQKALEIGNDFLIISEKMANLANACKPELKTKVVNGIMIYTFKSIKDNLDWLFVNHDYSKGTELTEEEKQLFYCLFVNASLYMKAYNKETLTEKEVKKLYGLHICLKHGGKMKGIHSISTNSMLNPFCIAHQKIDGCICQHCYAVNLIKSRPSMFIPLTINQLLFSNFIIQDELIPKIKSKKIRFEAFGDLGTVLQVVNYFNISKANGGKKCALWTKNPVIIKRALDKGLTKKPKNLQIIFSGFRLNQPISLETLQKVFPFIDCIFVVWEKEEDNPFINCGKRDCDNCGTCYNENGAKIVNEALKMAKKNPADK